jgi:hypothetical protein
MLAVTCAAMPRPHAVVSVRNKTGVISCNVIPSHRETKIMNKTAKPKQVEAKSKADFSPKVKVEGNFQMKLKSLTVAAALGAVVYSASLP